MTRKILLAAVLAGTLLGVTVAHAQPTSRPGVDRERERRVMDDRDYDGIGLSDAQRGRLRAMDDGTRPARTRGLRNSCPIFAVNDGRTMESRGSPVVRWPYPPTTPGDNRWTSADRCSLSPSPPH